MDIKKQLITPQIAEAYLGRNPKNRNVSKPRVAMYASDMAAGRWKINPAPIVLDVNGNLIDGQHRLLAVIESGLSVEMFVATGAPAETMDVIDNGKSRTAGDVLSIHKVLNSNNIAALAKKILAYEKGSLSIVSDPGKGGALASNNTLSTRQEVVDYAMAHNSKLQEIIAVGYQIYGQSPIKLISPADIGFLVYALKPQEKALPFIKAVIAGTGLEERTAALAMRRLLERVRVKKELPISASDLTRYFFVAFQKYVKGEEVEFLRLPKKKK